MILYNYLTALFLVTTISFGFSPKNDNIKFASVEWIDIEQVPKLVKEIPKSVFINFTAKWCGWCKVMDKKTFSDLEVSTYMNKNYYSVKMDFDSNKTFNYLGKECTAKQLAKKYGVTGLPTMLLVSSDFKTVIQIVGYQKPNPFLRKLKEFNQ